MSTLPRRPLILVAVLGAAITLSGCASPAANQTVQPGQLVGVWALDKTFDSPEQPYIAFVQDSSWSASDGCNRVQGTWDLAEDGTITTTAGPSTLMACDGAQLPLAVSRADSVSVSGDTLTIHSSFDSTVTELVRSTDPKVGPQGFPVGYWVESSIPDSPFLSISADGTFTGNDGCNTIFGSWSSDDSGSTEFSQVGTTLMACEGEDQWLGQLASATVQSGVMTVASADGQVLGQLNGR